MVEITIIHCKCKFGIVRMLIKIPRDLNLYPTVDQRQMKTIYAKYNARVGYWVLRLNV
jgi:hypothetical protein